MSDIDSANAIPDERFAFATTTSTTSNHQLSDPPVETAVALQVDADAISAAHHTSSASDSDSDSDSESDPPPPPPLPPGSIYTSCYCEENVYLLAQAIVADSHIRNRWDAYAVFVSNERRTVALWNQKARADGVVVWDYHVFLALKLKPKPKPKASRTAPDSLNLYSDALPRARCWVYDADSRLGAPCPWEGKAGPQKYFEGTFPYVVQEGWEEVEVPTEYRSLLRIVPADVYLAQFASDRSHMLAPPVLSVEPLSPVLDGANAIRIEADSISGREDPDARAEEGEDAAPASILTQEPGLASVSTLAPPPLAPEAALRYVSPPPAYPCIQGSAAAARGVSHNLMQAFVNMRLGRELGEPGSSLESELEMEMGRVYDVKEGYLWGFDEEGERTGGVVF